MAKFLPFVVEKSTPIHIFQTIVSRSKGMNDILVASIFYLVLEKGIALVRETASELPNDLDAQHLYEAILNAYPSFRVQTDSYNTIQQMLPFVTDSENFLSKIHKDLRDYSMKDILSFLVVMILTDEVSDYTSLGFDSLFNGKGNKVLERLNDTKLFANDCPLVAFSSIEELNSYVIWHHLIAPEADESPSTVTAMYSNRPSAIPPWKPNEHQESKKKG